MDTCINTVLCDDLMLCIFKHLNDGTTHFMTLREVCKWWRDIIGNMCIKTIVAQAPYTNDVHFPHTPIRVFNADDYRDIENYGHCSDVHVTITCNISSYPIVPGPRVKSLTLDNVLHSERFNDFYQGWFLSDIDSLKIILMHEYDDSIINALHKLIPQMKMTSLTLIFGQSSDDNEEYYKYVLSKDIHASAISTAYVKFQIYSRGYGYEKYSYVKYPKCDENDCYSINRHEYNSGGNVYVDIRYMNRNNKLIYETFSKDNVPYSLNGHSPYNQYNISPYKPDPKTTLDSFWNW
jgi:hypothetical protein